MRCAAAIIASVGLCAVATAQPKVWVGVDTTAVDIQVWDIVNGVYAPAIPAGGNAVVGMAADNAAGVVYFSTRTQLWKIPVAAPQTPVLVGAFSGATTTMPGGLAFDSARGVLLGTTAASLYQISTTNASTTLVRTIAGADFGGLDYDAANDRLLATNDSTSTTAPLVGRGLYTIAPPYASGPVARLALYPTGEVDIDGLAVGGGFAYLCEDETNSMHVFDLGELNYPSAIPQTGIGVDRVACGAAFVNPAAPDFDLSVSLAPPAPCTARVGAAQDFTITLNLGGAQPASDVVVDFAIPPNTTVVRSSPQGVIIGDSFIVSLQEVAPGVPAQVIVTLDFLSAGPLQAGVVVDSASPDPDSSNNTAQASITVLPATPATASVRGMISTVATSSSSLVAGLGGERYAEPAGFGPPSRSPDGRQWIMKAGITASADTDEVLIRWLQGVTSVVARENQFPLLFSFGGTYAPFDLSPAASVNDAGNYAFACVDNRISTANDGLIVKVVGSTPTVVAQEGVTASPVAGATFSFGADSVHIASDNSVSFFSTLAGGGVTASNDTGLFTDDGAAILAREGVTVPTGQVDSLGVPTAFSFKSFDAGDSAAGRTSLSMNADGASYMGAGAINASTSSPPSSGVDRVVFAGSPAAVLVQENVLIPGAGFSSPADNLSPVTFARMESNGDTIVRGDNLDGQDWVMVNGAVVARRGEPITAGAGETWSDTAFADCFFFSASFQGRLVIGGATSRADALTDSVLVADGAVVARENDPVDLDGNGIFDDDAYISRFDADRGFVGADGVVIVAFLRNGAAASGCAPDSDIGRALVLVALPPLNPCGSADFDGDGDVGTDADIEAFFACLAGSCCQTCGTADFNNDGDVGTDADIEAFFRVLAGGAC